MNEERNITDPLLHRYKLPKDDKWYYTYNPGSDIPSYYTVIETTTEEERQKDEN